MKVVRVNLGLRSYDIQIGEGVLASCGELFRDHRVGSRIFLIANTTVWDLYGQPFMECLKKDGFDVVQLLIPDGESFKNIHTVENIYTYLIAQRADRNSTLVALGGGVTGDITGFVAATFLRGVPYIQIPTTLLAQVDSSVGGKTGVNHRLGKNLIGAFYQPNLVCVDTRSLATLPEREFRAGLFEVIKYGLIYDAHFFDYFDENLGKILERETAVLEAVISRCCEIKAEVISIDEREENLRQILNFGHTLGHALEVATEYNTFKHGEAVAYGMLAAAHLSHHEGLVDSGDLDRIRETVLRIGPLPAASEVPFSQLLDAIRLDKKRREDETVLVLLKEIGQTLIKSGFEEDLLADVWGRAVADVAQHG